MNRTQNAMKNAFWGVTSKMINLIFAFISRTAFIYILGSTYLGVNGLYSEILSLLSFAELGFGSAMTFSMYKPVVYNDEIKIIKLLDFYKKVYSVIAAIIMLLGLLLVPFLGVIVRGADWITVKELRLYFLVYLFNTVVGYFVTYKYTYLNALQKNYVQTNIDAVVTTISYVVQIVVIFAFKSFFVYLMANSIILLLSRGVIVLYLNRKYPILKEHSKEGLSREEKKPIYKEVRGLAVHQFASVAVHSTDNILISTMTNQGVGAVGLISNYNMLMNAVLGFVTIVFNSVTSGFGNLAASSSTEKYRGVFKEINFANFWIYGFCSIAFWLLIPPFITLWIGADKVIDETAFALIIINCYFQGQSTAYNNARIAKGNFGKDKGWAIVQALTNLVVSVVGAKMYGLVGIYVGTVASRMVYVVFRPYSTYKFLFDESAIEYYKQLVRYFSFVLIAAFLTRFVVNRILNDITIGTFLLAAITVVVVPNMVFLTLTAKTEEFLEWKRRILRIIANLR